MDQHGDPIKRLMFACRNCDYQEEADNNCVYRNEIVHAPAYVHLLFVWCLFKSGRGHEMWWFLIAAPVLFDFISMLVSKPFLFRTSARIPLWYDKHAGHQDSNWTLDLLINRPRC